MAEFGFEEVEGFDWVDAADIRRFPQLEHFYMIDSRPYARVLIKNKGIENIDGSSYGGWIPIVRGYVENGQLYISSKDKLYPISKPKEYDKVWIYKKPIKSKRNETVEI